jgi:hypothetical protein
MICFARSNRLIDIPCSANRNRSVDRAMHAMITPLPEFLKFRETGYQERTELFHQLAPARLF